MIFSKVRVTTKREKCQSSLCRSTFGNHSALGLCFLPRAPSSGPTDMRWCTWRRAGGVRNKKKIPSKSKQCYICSISYFLTNRVRETCNLETTAARSQPTGSEQRGRRTLIHKCLLHALNGCSPWWISSPDALSMRCSLSASQPQPRARRLRHLFPSSVLL